MSTKLLSLLAIATVAMIMVPVIDVDAGSAVAGDYESQLDSNGKGLYDTIVTELSKAEGSPTDTVTVSYDVRTPVLFESTEAGKAEAGEYAIGMVNDVLAALYYTDPSYIWLWDYPVTGAVVDKVVEQVALTSEGTSVTYYTVSAVSFQLNVPEAFKDDPSTEKNETLDAITSVRDKMRSFEGSVMDKVSAINDVLRGVSKVDEEEGKVGNIYDALVTGKSTSAGIAAAFTCMCAANGVDAQTVRGSVLKDMDANTAVGYWNMVFDEDKWYAVDCSWNSSEARNCLMVGFTSKVVVPGQDSFTRFGASHNADLDMSAANSLSTPVLESEGVSWPDDSTILEKYGSQIFMVIIGVVLAGAFIYAIRTGNV